MSNLALRFINNECKDLFSSISNWVPIWPKYGEVSKFAVSDHNAALVRHNEGFYEVSHDTNSVNRAPSYNLKGSNFTLSLWLKFKDEFCNKDNSIVQNKMIFSVNETENMEYNLNTDTDWHHYAIVRIQDGIRMYIDGRLIHGLTTSSYVNFDADSYLYIGQPIKYCFGDTFVIDDVYLFSAALWNTSVFTPPEQYLPTDAYYRIFEEAKNNTELQTNYYAQSGNDVVFTP